MAEVVSQTILYGFARRWYRPTPSGPNIRVAVRMELMTDAVNVFRNGQLWTKDGLIPRAYQDKSWAYAAINSH